MKKRKGFFETIWSFTGLQLFFIGVTANVIIILLYIYGLGGSWFDTGIMMQQKYFLLGILGEGFTLVWLIGILMFVAELIGIHISVRYKNKVTEIC